MTAVRHAKLIARARSLAFSPFAGTTAMQQTLIAIADTLEGVEREAQMFKPKKVKKP